MGNTTITLKIIAGDELYIDPDFVATDRKPENVCYWCHQPTLDQETINSKVTYFGKYYAFCPECQRRRQPDKNVLFMEAGPVQGLIDQPMYEGEYPTGECIEIPRDIAAKFVHTVTEGQVEVDDDTEEVLLYPDGYTLLEDFVLKN